MPEKSKKLSRAKRFAEVEFLSVAGFKYRMGPTGLWVYGKDYKNAAAILPQPSVPYEPVRFYLVCHSIELLLKAFLSLRGATMLELSENKYGHDLEKLLDAALEYELDTLVNLPARHIAEVRKAAIYYGGKVFEYPAVGDTSRRTIIPAFKSCLCHLCRTVRA